VLTPVGVLDREKQVGVVRELTDIVATAAKDPTLTSRTWVLITESPEGAAASVPPFPEAGQRARDAAYRLRLARSIQNLLRGYRLEYSEVARHPLSAHSINAV